MTRKLGRMRPLCSLLLGLALSIAASPARAEPRLLEEAREALDRDQCREAIAKVKQLQQEKALAAESELVEGWRILGLSQVYCGSEPEARRAFVELLFTDPDFELDPHTVSADAKRLFDAVKAEQEPSLAPIRDQRREFKRQQEEARRKQLEEAERLRRQKDAPVLLRKCFERHSLLSSFLPFGAAQFEQGRPQAGALFAVGQVLTLTASIVSYAQVKSLVGADGKVDSAQLDRAKAWRTANWISFGATLGVLAGGFVDAVAHYQEQTDIACPLPAEPSKAPARPAARLFLSPTPGGVAAGIIGRF